MVWAILVLGSTFKIFKVIRGALFSFETLSPPVSEPYPPSSLLPALDGPEMLC
jgi:hypothetical protein